MILGVCLNKALPRLALCPNQQYILNVRGIINKMSRRAVHHNAQKRLRVLVDMDQVLCDFEGSFLATYREINPEEPFIPIAERNTFYIADQYAKLGPEYQDKAREIWNTEGFFLNLPEIEGACDAVKKMSQMEDVDVFICTSPLTFYKYCLQEKFRWVEDHLGADWINRLVITKDKTMVHGDVLIDDKPRIQGVRDPLLGNRCFSLPPTIKSGPSWQAASGLLD